MNETATKIDVCARCSKTIRLRRINPTSEVYRWYVGKSWRCQPDPDFPVRSHAPRFAESRA